MATATTTTAECPECGAELEIPGNVEKGEILQCNDCGSELEVVGVNPVELALAPEEAEDWGE
jgi:alpha-aminoadipate/glutamate carrier protein LysW